MRYRNERDNPQHMTTAIYSHADCQRHEMGQWHPESPARLQAIADQLINAHIDDLLEHREAPLADLADIAWLVERQTRRLAQLG